MQPVVATFQLSTEIVCARLGTKRSDMLVAAGGADNCVHIMPFASGNRLAKLEGHTTKVTCAAFDREQQRVVAGSDGGSLRVWDMNTEQGIRSFGTGHRTTVTSVDYHSFGEFVASVSLDTHLRIWDVRKKTCLQSYKGCSAELRVVQFCPSGRWVASGCAEGVVRLYDLNVGKAIGEFVAHSGPITSLQFHPEHYFLAAGSSDGTLSLWDLESSKKVFQTVPAVEGAVQMVHFADQSLLSAASRVLRRYDFANMSNHQAKTMQAPWQEVSDIVFAPASEEILAVEKSGSAISMTRFCIAANGAKNPAAVKQAVRAEIPKRREGPSQPTIEVLSPASDRAQQQPKRTFQMAPLQQLNVVTAASCAEESRAAIAMLPATSSGTTEAMLVEDLLKTSSAMSSIIHRRLTHTRVLRSLWPQDTKSALSHLQKIADDGTDGGVVVDFLVAMQQQRMKEKITVELLPDLMGIIVSALNSHGQQRSEPTVVAALRVARSMNTKFRAKLEEHQRAAMFAANGVDLAMEARLERFRATQKRFDEVAQFATARLNDRGTIGEEARSLLSEMPQLVAQGRR
jgi:katanin p80 WD40 repeat-containing subunit B1